MIFMKTSPSFDKECKPSIRDVQESVNLQTVAYREKITVPDNVTVKVMDPNLH